MKMRITGYVFLFLVSLSIIPFSGARINMVDDRDGGVVQRELHLYRAKNDEILDKIGKKVQHYELRPTKDTTSQ